MHSTVRWTRYITIINLLVVRTLSTGFLLGEDLGRSPPNCSNAGLGIQTFSKCCEPESACRFHQDDSPSALARGIYKRTQLKKNHRYISPQVFELSTSGWKVTVFPICYHRYLLTILMKSRDMSIVLLFCLSFTLNFRNGRICGIISVHFVDVRVK